MKEKFPNESKNKWTRIFRKKWFFPAVYISIAALLLATVVWYQGLESKIMEGLDSNEQSESYIPNPFDEDAKSVVQQSEVIKMPVQDESQAEIVTKFFDYNAEQEEQEQGLNLYNNRYYQSTGIDVVSSDGETFDVVASLTGTVIEVKEDPLLGNVVVMSHGNDISTYYASLGEVTVEAGEMVDQGKKIGVAGKNLFSQDSGTHVHFQIWKNDIEVNPEQFFNEPLSKLEDFDAEANEEVEEPKPDDEEGDDEKSDEQSDEDDGNSDSKANKDLSLSGNA